jgi:hypothetical protein
MKIRAIAVCLLFAETCSAREHDYQQGTVIAVDSSPCAQLTPSATAGSCQEYILQSDHMLFRIRPKDEKHPALLPVGESAQFRVGKGALLVRVPEISGKEHPYVVISFRAREDATSASILQQQSATVTASKN